MKKIVCIILVIILFSGCDIENTNALRQMDLSELILSEQISEKHLVVPPTTPPTEPDKRLDVASGSYCDRYICSDSINYMDYWIHVPDHATKEMPLIVFLHGSGQVGQLTLLENYGIASAADKIYGNQFPFLLLLPCTHVQSWTDENVSNTLIELIQYIVSVYEADPDRIIITGHSLGSIGTWKLISRYPDLFAAAVPVSCGIDEMIDFQSCAKVPIMAFAGTVGYYENNYNRAMHQLVSQINEAGGNATMSVLEDATHENTSEAAYTEETFEWMLSQKKE